MVNHHADFSISIMSHFIICSASAYWSASPELDDVDMFLPSSSVPTWNAVSNEVVVGSPLWVRGDHSCYGNQLYDFTSVLTERELN